MENSKFNTDMADERVDEYKLIHNMSDIDGIEIEQEEFEEFKVTKVEVTNENGAKSIDKEIGKYITFEIENVKYLEDTKKAINKLKEYILELIESNEKESTLIVGLGNRYVTPDALGSKVINKINVTRHVLKLAKGILPTDSREVSAISPGVMGNTGIETPEFVSSICKLVSPNIVIVIDSLMSKSINRVGNSIQLSNTGISPGSGISKSNSIIDRNSTNAKVISIGVPMVVDIATIVNDTLSKIEKIQDEGNFRYMKIAQTLDNENYIVTPKDIDELIEIMSNIISNSINDAM